MQKLFVLDHVIYNWPNISFLQKHILGGVLKFHILFWEVIEQLHIIWFTQPLSSKEAMCVCVCEKYRQALIILMQRIPWDQSLVCCVSCLAPLEGLTQIWKMSATLWWILHFEHRSWYGFALKWKSHHANCYYHWKPNSYRYNIFHFLYKRQGSWCDKLFVWVRIDCFSIYLVLLKLSYDK